MRRAPLPLAAAAMLAPVTVLAQPADLPIPPATTTSYPAGFKVAKTPAGEVYVDAKGRTLYGMDMRTVIRWSPDAALYCNTGRCADWEPVLAKGEKVNVAFPTRGGGGGGAPLPEGIVSPQKAPDWTVISGPQGPQWVYKGWHMVFTRKGEPAGAAGFDGADNSTWNTLKFVPPAPKPVAPGELTTVLVDGRWALADGDGQVLFTGICSADCAGWSPLPAGLASRGLGEWSVGRDGDTPQWRYRGKPVYVSGAEDKTSVPAGAEVLRP